VPDSQGKPALGRFGLKAGTATVRDQSAAAFAGDMGLSTALHPDPWGDCTTAQTACRTAPDGQEPGQRDGLEVDRQSLDLVAFYARNLAVPERRNPGDPTILRGKQIFYDLDCTGCHTPKYVTARLPDQPEQSFQLIWPYTDLLLHDMGEALADHRPEGRATGREWKTPPLWGIGLTAQVSRLFARRPRPHPAGGDPVAWRRSPTAARRRGGPAQTRPRRADRLSGKPVDGRSVGQDHAYQTACPARRRTQIFSKRFANFFEEIWPQPSSTR